MSDHDQWHDDPDGTEAGTDVNRTKVKKAPTAFRTISEVADDLHIPQHVLRFWEQRFPQVKPLKRGGGRRYYRPEDVELLRRISSLLYVKGYTIKGVQRLLREGGSLEGIEPRTGVEGEADVGPDDETDELPFEPQPASRAHQALRRPASRPVALSAPQPPEPSMVVRSVLQPVPNAASGSLDIVGLQALLEELIALRDVLPR